jgi:predicted Rossmann fold nucleotide-binding protein DprA/Smf involved in DNA uptake
MKLAIVGSRTFNDYEVIKDVLKEFKITEIVSGSAEGADALAERYAAENNIPVKIFKPDWVKHGHAAGQIRNEQIVVYADKVIAILDGISSGTRCSIDLATEQGKIMMIKRY